MELSKHKNHRNAAYLGWLRKQKCVVTGQKAQCAHHIRLGTNGGSSLKPSDYFCIPLLNEYHSTGLFAIHSIGEDTFFNQFKLNREKLFIGYLKQYIAEKFKTNVELKSINENELIAYMINFIEENGPQKDKARKKVKAKKQSDSPVVKKSITENEFYQKAKEQKRIKDKELRAKIKEETKSLESAPKPTVKKASSSLKNNEFYQEAKEQKRIKDKELRREMKVAAKKKSKAQSEYEQKAKEQRRARDKEFRAKFKLTQKSEKTGTKQSEYHKRAKELKRQRDKEFRAKLKEQRKKAKK